MLSDASIIKDYVSELSRLQNWMLAIKEKDPTTYSSMLTVFYFPMYLSIMVL